MKIYWENLGLIIISKILFGVNLFKFSRKFSRISKKCQLKKDRENLLEVLEEFYFKFDKILNKICKIVEQI